MLGCCAMCYRFRLTSFSLADTLIIPICRDSSPSLAASTCSSTPQTRKSTLQSKLYVTLKCAEYATLSVVGQVYDAQLFLDIPGFVLAFAAPCNNLSTPLIAFERSTI